MKLFLSVLLFAASSAVFAQLAPNLVQPSTPSSPGAPATPAAAAPSIAVAPAPAPHSISLDVKVVRSGGASTMNQSSGVTGAGTTRTTNTNSRERERGTQYQLEVNVRNFAQRADQVTVEWMFFSEYFNEQSAAMKDEKEKDPLRTLGKGSKEVTFKPGGSEKLTLESETALLFESRSSTVTTTRASSTSSSSGVSAYNNTLKIGHKATGWLVRVSADGKILAVKASAPRFEELAQDDAALAAIRPTDNRLIKGLAREPSDRPAR